MNTPVDPAAEVFMAMAERDFVALRKMATDADFADEIFGFHAQQAVEKASKAVLAARGVAIERTHDLELLFDAIAEQAILDMSPFNSLVDLSDFAVQYRYQAFDDAQAGIDRGAICSQVRSFLDAAARVLSTESDARGM